jgi:hypothetical protein
MTAGESLCFSQSIIKTECKGYHRIKHQMLDLLIDKGSKWS